ncbi:hypothetical protein [Bacillus swezeyi]|uniref:Uncharacterized protein n=1 Tax=Bacillus swezeyi TaxID=1925020 RepID=A0A5M8RZI3_9BACI|nr:hypothetical protein [Bacillus swezeyi]KAA6452733.1 hypothetical protein DX927_00460 [Bacillus swezeyi]KAA6472289.1 hypothetical protein DX928_22990 [Bacillus swezeyi]TYS38099.1 hypothetical protein FZC77_00395 [Bacillus swezeyi]
MKTTITYSPYPSNFSEVKIDTGEDKSITLSLVLPPEASEDPTPFPDTPNIEDNDTETSVNTLAEPILKFEINDGIATEQIMGMNKENTKVLLQIIRDFLKQM